MSKPTKWEKDLVASGQSIITWEHDEIMDYLLMVFNRDKDDLLLKAAADNTKRHELCFCLDYEAMCNNQGTNFGGTIVYNKKLRKFTTIQYSDKRNFAVTFSIVSKVAFFSYDFYKQLKPFFPFGCSAKKLAHWVINN